MRFASSAFSALSVIGIACVIVPTVAQGVSVQAHGQAAIVGDYTNGLPPGGLIYQAVRVPLGLTLEARPTNNLAAFLDLRLGLNQYPELARSLGNSQGTESKPTLPFSPDDWSHRNRNDVIRANFGYIEYSSNDFGLFRVGRMPRHWGLGIWRNDAGVSPSPHYRDWMPEAGTVSTTDGVSMALDFRNIYVGAHWEKNAEGSPVSKADDAESWTVDMVVGDSLTEASQSTFAREVGIAFSRYTASESETRMNILDLYSRLRYGSVLLEGEFLYPNGSTQSAQYSQMGGADVCNTDASLRAKNLMCTSASLDWVSGLFKAKYIFSNTGTNPTQSSNEAATRRGVPTVTRRESHSAGVWLGFASGDSDAFATGNNNINLGVMHPNITPSLLMFSSLGNVTPGMPGALVSNALFARGEYTYESPTTGTIVPAIIWGRLNATRDPEPGKTLAASSGVGRYSNLGLEFQVAYSYMTTDFLKISAETALWLPGSAWTDSGSRSPDHVLGGRLSVSTIFH